jgi:hypothetical protein
MFRSEVGTRRTGGGKVKAPRYMVTRGGALVGTDGGVAPSSTHEGATDALKSGESTSHGTGKRHIDPTKSLDDTIPQRFGKKVVHGDVRPQWNTHFNDRNVPARGSHGGGSAVQEIQRRVEGKVGVRKFQARRASNGAFDEDAPIPESPQRRTPIVGLTAEQRAVERLNQYAHRDASVRRDVEEVLKKGSALDIISKEDQLHRRELRVQAAEELRQHSKPAPYKADHLPAPSAPNKAPFATTMNDDLKGHRGSQGSKRKTFGAESIMEREMRLKNEEIKQRDFHSGRRHRPENATDLPYDTADSGAPYPEPPAVGQIVPKTSGKRPPHRSGLDNRSTNFIPDGAEPSPTPVHHSVRRNPCHNRHSISVFEEPPVPNPNYVSRGTLRDAHEAKYSSTTERPVTGGKARVRAAQTTSLW